MAFSVFFPARVAVLSLAVATCFGALPASSQTTVLSGDHAVDGNLCAGPNCDAAGLNGPIPFRLKGPTTSILFPDTSPNPEPNAGWELRANDDAAGGDEFFSIANVETGQRMFQLDGAAPTNSLFVSGTGNIGLGTSLPTADITIERADFPTILLRQNTSGGGSASSWLWYADDDGTGYIDGVSNSYPFTIATGVPNGALELSPSTFSINEQFTDYDLVVGSIEGIALITNGQTGNVGMGTPSPNAALHVRRVTGEASILVENSLSSPSAVREMFKMANNGGSYFTLDNTQAGTTWFFVHEDASPNRFIITDGVNDGPEMTLTADGVLTIEGGFVAGSTSLNVPDYVFSDGYALRPLAEVARYIEANQHLPEVPSAAQIADTGLNMTEMQMTHLKKIEELTLYTLQQENRIAAQENAMATLLARLDALESNDTSD